MFWSHPPVDCHCHGSGTALNPGPTTKPVKPSTLRSFGSPSSLVMEALWSHFAVKERDEG